MNENVNGPIREENLYTLISIARVTKLVCVFNV